MAVGAPFDIEHAAVEDDLSMAAGQPAARCRDQRGAGAAAAGARVDRATAGRQPLRVEKAGNGFDANALLAGLVGHEARDTARAVAAGLGLAAVGIEDAHEYLRGGIARRLDQDQLVAADAGPAVG